MRLAYVTLFTTFVGLFPSPAVFAKTVDRHFTKPVDALSMTFSKKGGEAELSYEKNGVWSGWRHVEIDDEQDPKSLESELIMLPSGVTDLRVTSANDEPVIHPIEVSDAPVTYKVAGPATDTPTILTRSEWGADDSLLYRDKPASSSSSEDATNAPSTIIGDTATGRERDCETMIVNYPQEFKTTRRRTEVDGKTLRWAQEYSPKVKLLVVHHTAIEYGTDDRSGAERMRALYAYHANNRGWGDIGYHYVIDEEGQIYEGKAGGPGVVGGHAYCNNVGTLGIALMGNFEVQKPTQIQMKNLQWLLMTLAERYDIDLGNSVTFHGETLPPVVRHRDLLSTTCPGYYVAETIDQVRTNAARGNWLASVTFPTLASDSKSKTAERKAARESTLQSTGVKPVTGLIPLGGTALQGRPGEQALLSIRYQAGANSVQRDTAIGNVSKSDPLLRLWVNKAGKYDFLRDKLFLPLFVKANDSVTMQFKIQMPRAAGSYGFSIGDASYTVAVSGRRVRTPAVTTAKANDMPAVTLVSTERAQTSGARTQILSTESSATSSTSPLIRIRLGYGKDDVSDATSATVSSTAKIKVNGASVAGPITFRKQDDSCVASTDKQLASGTVRVDAGDAILTIDSWEKAANQFRGTIECRVVDGALTLINELPLEQYMAGIAEEPDTEPFEKQKAFAVAARSYAAYYMDASHRKFPNKPYDGSDSPADFQLYGGYAFELKHAQWVRAAGETKNIVLKKDNAIIRAAFFSADDGRTRSPDEIGWKNFPNADVFASKKDPWCANMTLRGHGVGMSGCGAEGQANDGKKYDEILKYYYTGVTLSRI